MKRTNFFEHWVVKPMTEVVKWGSGGTPKAIVKEYYENGTIPWLVIGDLNDSVVTTSATKITQLGLENSSAKVVPANTLLVAMYGSIGKLGITGMECCTNQAIAFAKELIGVTTKYMYYFMMSSRNELIEKGKGGTQKNISQTVLNSINVPVPPLPEQQRIVAKIEELFAELDNSVAMLKKVKEQINQYNESLMEQIFQQNDCSWEEYKLGDEKICSINKNFNLPDFEDEDIVSFLPMAAVEAKINKFYPQTTTYGKVKKGYTKFRNGDVLFAKITPCMENGKICIVNDLIKDCGFGSTEFHVLRCSENLLPKFLYYFVSRERFLRRAVPYMTGSVGQKRMPSDYLAEQKIKVPSINVQKQIINDIEDKISKSGNIENILDSILVNCDALRQSILKKAFEGEL